MSWSTRDAATTRRLTKARSRGLRATLRKSSTLVDSAGEPVLALAVDGTVAVGETQLVLDAASVRGTLPEGAQITIAGVSGTHTLASDATAAANALTVELSAAIAQEAADDAAVVIVQDYGETTAYARRENFASEDIDGEVIETGDFILVVATSAEIDKSFGKLTFDGSDVAIVRRMPHKPGATQASVKLHCRGAA